MRTYWQRLLDEKYRKFEKRVAAAPGALQPTNANRAFLEKARATAKPTKPPPPPPDVGVLAAFPPLLAAILRRLAGGVVSSSSAGSVSASAVLLICFLSLIHISEPTRH